MKSGILNYATEASLTLTEVKNSSLHFLETTTSAGICLNFAGVDLYDAVLFCYQTRILKITYTCKIYKIII